MARPKKKEADRADRPVNFRASGDLFARLEDIAAGLGLDISNLIRMILRENLHLYERRVAEVRRRESES